MRILQLLGAVLILFASPAMAKDAAAWVVAQKSGDVRVLRNGMQPASVSVRAALSPGDVVATGADGRAMLTKGDDYVVVAPGSRLVLPKEQLKSGFTRLMQEVGTMLYKVKRTGVPHFEVETPVLAAVVKGTTFTVVVDAKGAAVQVTEGVVEVISLTGDSRRLVEGGLTVYVGRERPNDIISIRPGTAILPELGNSDGDAVKVDGSGDVSLGTVTKLTDGLVREAPVATTEPVKGNVVTTTLGGSATTTIATPIADVADTTDIAVTTVIEPALDSVETVAPAIIEPVVGLAETLVPTVTEPVVEVVQAVLPVATQPVVEIIQTTVPIVTQPVVEIVQTTVPVVTQPVVEIVQTTVPVVTQPVVQIVQPVIPVVPVVTQPVIDIVNTVPNVVCIVLCGR